MVFLLFLLLIIGESRWVCAEYVFFIKVNYKIHVVSNNNVDAPFALHTVLSRDEITMMNDYQQLRS
jgi:hypothetical protein